MSINLACKEQHAALTSSSGNTIQKVEEAHNTILQYEKLFIATVNKSILLYGSETWTITKSKKPSKKIDRCYIRMLRMALDIDWRAHKTNKEVYGTLPRASFKIQERRMRLAGYLKRHNELIAHKLFLWEPTQGYQSHGRPILTYIDVLRRDTGLSNLREIKGLVKDRLLWRRIIDTRT